MAVRSAKRREEHSEGDGCTLGKNVGATESQRSIEHQPRAP